MATAHKITYGFVEKAVIMDSDLMVTVKMDTGAKSASLSAIKIYAVEKNGETFLRFTVPTKKGEAEFEAPFVGTVKIKVRAMERKAAQHKTDPMKRPVVLLRVKIGNIERKIPVNLANRKRFNYPFLLGRDAIKAFDGVVDPSLKFVVPTHLDKS